jgi:hypothetical protein
LFLSRPISERKVGQKQWALLKISKNFFIINQSANALFSLFFSVSSEETREWSGCWMLGWVCGSFGLGFRFRVWLVEYLGSGSGAGGLGIGMAFDMKKEIYFTHRKNSFVIYFSVIYNFKNSVRFSRSHCQIKKMSHGHHDHNHHQIDPISATTDNNIGTGTTTTLIGSTIMPVPAAVELELEPMNHGI